MNDNQQHEITILLDGRKETTAKQYLSCYNKFKKRFPNGIASEGQEILIKFINELDAGNSTKYNIMMMPIIIKKHLELPFNLLEEEREKLGTLKKQKEQDNCVEQNKLGITYEMFKSFLTGMETELKKNKTDLQKIQIYLINYLLNEFQVRNQDLNVFITDNPDEIKDDKRNYLFIKKNTVEYIRNIYKTVSTHGIKTHLIKSKFIADLCKVLNNKYLLGFDEPAKNIASYIIPRTFMNLGEGKIYKLIVQHSLTNPDPIGSVDKLTKSRGSSLNCVASNYNLNAGL